MYGLQDLGALFQNTTCQLLRMDMLYEAGHYRQVLDAFTTLQHAGVSAKFPPDCTTLAIAALYQLVCISVLCVCSCTFMYMYACKKITVRL